MTLVPRLPVFLLSLVLCLNACGQNTDVVGLYLTWQRAPATTMTINWVNVYEHTGETVWFRESGSKNWQSATGARHTVPPTTLQVRRVELTGLKPDTEHDFVLGSKPGSEPKGVRRFKTLPAKLDRPLRFVAGGDMMHNREFVDAMNKQAAALEPDFAVLGGDLAYANGVDATRWFDWFQSWMQHAKLKNGRCIPMVVAIGNHEVKGGYNGKIPDDAPFFYGFFPLPDGRAYYALDVADYLSFILLDSGHTNAVDGPQKEWLGKTLAGRSDRRFLFPVYHFPAYGTAKSDSDGLPCESKRAKEIRAHWIGQFESHGVSAVFEHDHHNYKRTHPLRRHQVDQKNGIVYLGDGAWGVNTRTVPDNAWYLAKAEPRRHLFLVTLNPDGTFAASAYDADGNEFDQVQFSRSRTTPEKP
jgi:3',5'-cyclic AMP phosphodiesterase CpdA